MKHLIKLYIIFFLSILTLYGCAQDTFKENVDEKNDTHPAISENLVSNFDFEKDVDLTKTSIFSQNNWSYVGGWNEAKGNVQQLINRGINGSRCLAFIAPSEDVDIKVGQRITGLKPNTYYKATARIKTEDVQNGRGAHISLDYLWAPTSEGVTGTKDWTTVSLEIDEVPASGIINLCVRLGNTAAASRGVAYFDNIILKENKDLYVRESEHFKIIIDKKNVSVSEDVVTEWLGNLDSVYKSLVTLFSGRKPFNGRKMVIRQAKINAWAYAGEPIQWNENYISSELLSLNKGNWSFGIMHETGHNFASHIAGGNRSWNWNEEIFANFRMYYALEQLNGVVVINASVPDGKGGYKNDEKKYVGSEIKTLYKSETSNCYDRTIGVGSTAENGNAVCWTLIRIQERYGWDIFIKAFDELYKLPQNTEEEKNWSQWQKFEYFLSFLSKYAGEDVRTTTYSKNELDVIKRSLEILK